MKRKFIFILMVFVILLTFSVISNATCEIIRIDVKNGKSEKIEINVDKEINKTSEFIKTPTPRNQSGAPILNLANDVIGVHGGTIYGGQSNRGIWITQYAFNNVLDAINNN